MKGQLDIFTAIDRSIPERFDRFHAANPDVYDALVTLAREARDAGAERIGIGMLWEVLRWQRTINPPVTTAAYRFNNSYRSRYARLIMEREPDLSHMFETRRLYT